MMKNANDQSHRKLQTSIDHQLNTSQMKISDIIINSNANKVLIYIILKLNTKITFRGMTRRSG